MDYQCFTNPPSDFTPFVEVSSCYCECDNRILLLKRQIGKPYENLWGVPAGKIDQGETPYDALFREVYEEVGIELLSEKVIYIGKLFFRIPMGDYVYHMFVHSFENQPEITLAIDEAEEARWTTLAEAADLPLMPGAFDALKTYAHYKDTL